MKSIKLIQFQNCKTPTVYFWEQQVSSLLPEFADVHFFFENFFNRLRDNAIYMLRAVTHFLQVRASSLATIFKLMIFRKQKALADGVLETVLMSKY